MRTVTVAGVMTPAEALPAVTMDTTLLDAARALKQCAASAPVPLLVAVRDGAGQVAGILGMVDLLRGLDPKYESEGFFPGMAGQGVSAGVIEMLCRQCRLSHEALEAFARIVTTRAVKDLAILHGPDETVEASASLDEAMDLMALRGRDCLIAVRDGRAVGVIDAASIFDALVERARL
jgi:CBS domain-containing protein